MRNNRKIGLIIALIAVFLNACASDSTDPELIIKSDAGPPSPQAEAWLGDWTVWLLEILEEVPEDLIISAEGNQLKGEVFMNSGEKVKFFAELNQDGQAAVGTWESESGQTGTVSMILSEDMSRFAGGLHGFGPLCGTREGYEIPDPCESEFTFDWTGGWYVWIGPQETEGRFFYRIDDESSGPLSYVIKAFVSGDGSKLLGTWSAVGSTGEIEAQLLENGIQFIGNMDGQFPMCGVRPGGSKPDPCFGP